MNPIGFKSESEERSTQEGIIPRQEDKNSIIFDSETIPRLEKFKESLEGDPFSIPIIDSYIQLFTLGLLDITFNEVTGEPIATINKTDLPQFAIREPSYKDGEAEPYLNNNRLKN
jgi:hypothetical protein|tara:strand:- start:883 stop:1227 length:345 start_codon:yes stop_codon:yes gene_type:complete